MTRTPLLIILFLGCFLRGNAQPHASFTADKTTGCSPLVVHFSNQTTGATAAATFHWDLGNGNLVVAANPQAIYTTPGTYTVTLTVQDGGQTSSFTGTVTVDQPPTVNFSAGSAKVCAPAPIGFISSSVPGSSAIASYLWDFGDGSTAEVASPTVSHAFVAAGIDGVSLTVTDADGCASTKVVPNMVTIEPALTAAFTPDQQILCLATDPVTFTNTSTGPGTLSYQWAFGDGGSSTAASPTYSYAAKGLYNVVLTVTSSVGCVASDSLASRLNVASYQTSFTSPASVCAGSPMTFVDGSSPTPTQRTWLVDGATVGNYSPLSYVFILPGTHTVSLTNLYGTCPQTVTKTVTVNSPPVTPPFGMTLSTTCGAPVTVNFLDQTPNAVKWAWIFSYQGGDPYAQDTVFGGPAHSSVYPENGTYDVQLTVTNATGCSATETQVLSIFPPVITIIETDNTPEGACEPPLTKSFACPEIATLASWTWNFGDGTTSTSATPTHTFSAPGSFNTTLTWVNNNGCTGTTNGIPTIISGPQNLNFTANATTVCAGQTVSFTTPYQYSDAQVSWFFGDGGEYIYSDGNVDYTYETPGVYSVTLHVNEYSGCYLSNVLTNYITVLPAPTISFTAATTCDSPRAAVNFTVAAGNGATNVAWNFGDGTSQNTAPAVTALEHTYTRDQYYAVTATATNGTCTTASTVGVLVELKPIDYYLGVNATSICPAVGVFLSDTLHQIVPPGSSIDGYEYSNVQWYYADGTPFVGPQNYVDAGFGGDDYYTSELSQFQPGESGLYAVTTNAAGCKDTTNTVPLAIGGVTAAFTIIQDDQCYQQPVVLQDATLSLPGNPITSWLWNFGDGTTSTQSGTVSHLYTSPGNYPVTLTVTDALACTSASSPTATGTVTVNGPQAAFSSLGGNVLPVGSTAVFDNTSNTYGAPGVLYSWSFGDGSTTTDFSPTHVYALPGTYTVTLTAQGVGGGCVSTATLTLVIQPFNSAFQMSDTYVAAGGCAPLLVQFTNTSYNYTSLLWNFGDGVTVANVVNPSHVYAQPGTYYVSLTVVNGAGQTLVTDDSVIVRQPSGALTATPVVGEVCVGQADTLTGTAGKEVTGYTWDFGDGVVVGAKDSTVMHVYAVAGTYTARLVVTDTAGCMAAAASSVTVDVQAPPVAWVTPPKAAICLNGQITLTASGGVTYSWSPATGLSDPTVAAPVAAPVVTTAYTVTVASAIGCSSTQAVTVSVVQPATMSVTPDSAAICPGKTVALQASGEAQYTWIGATAGLSATDIANPVASPVAGAGDSAAATAVGGAAAGEVVYEVVGRDTLGCFADTLTVFVELLPQPTVSAGPDQTVQAETPVTLEGAATGDVVSWLWTPATYLSCTDCAQPVCTPKEPQQYIVSVTGGDGCMASDTVVVALTCDASKVRIPDAFTPNGDGHNDRWNILGISEVNHLVIFDRWGEKVFERDHFYPADADAGWDGTANGRPAAAGVYVYMAQMQCPTGGGFERKGTIVLIR